MSSYEPCPSCGKRKTKAAKECRKCRPVASRKRGEEPMAPQLEPTITPKLSLLQRLTPEERKVRQRWLAGHKIRLHQLEQVAYRCQLGHSEYSPRDEDFASAHREDEL